VPGESFLALLDALHGRHRIEFVTCRDEGLASLAAIVDAKLTERASVAISAHARSRLQRREASRPVCIR
jgi:acetolactate synthase-1/2/3 large subunit